VKLTTSAFDQGAPIPAEFAFCRIDNGPGHVALSGNLNPDFSWSEVPVGARSLALLCVDPDVPSVGDDVNQEGRTVPISLPRAPFWHWALVDLPPDMSSVARGAFSSGVTPRGKPGPQAAHGARQGINDYTGWFAGDAAMAGQYFGYDGPCPPWNDLRMHNYTFTLHALAVPRLELAGMFTCAEAHAALLPHLLGSASITGRYTLNPTLAY
jgi:Raf kinase inhibitor-like YbhB/YbcL family protein